MFHECFFVQALLSLTITHHFLESRLIPAGAGYVGAGYNIMLGNIDGIRFTSGGPDPGLLPTKIILQKSIPFPEGYCPVEAICTEVAQNVMDDQYSVVADLPQYQALFSSAWKFASDDELMPLETVYSGSLSSPITEAKEILENANNIIVDKRKVTIAAEIRYNYRENHHLTREFALDMCDLPLEYDTDVYRRFILLWGTHVIVAVQAGEIDVQRYEIPFVVLNNLLIVNPELSKMLKIDGATSTVSYNSTAFQDMRIIQGLIDATENNDGFRKWHFSSGSPQIPSPIYLTLRSLDDFIKPEFFESLDFSCSNLQNSSNIQLMRGNIKYALLEYPLEPKAPMFLPVQRSFKMDWPRGTYALIKTINCPEAPPGQVWTGTGKRMLFDRLDVHIDRLPETEFSVDLEPKNSRGTLSLSFCVKLSDSTNGIYDWPMGSYCIFKKTTCPAGFRIGSVTIPSERATTDDDAMPDGFYSDRSSMFEFCCRNDRPIDRAIILPTTNPFSLLSSGGQCQKIKGMEAGLRIQSVQKGSAEGIHPFVTTSLSSNIMRLYFCFYKLRTENDDT